jgi:hypothetical protein
MKRKGLWALAAVLACAAFVQLTISASSPAPKLTEKQHKEKIMEKRAALEKWLNGAAVDISLVVGEAAVTVDEKGKGVGQGRAAHGNRWKGIVGSGRKIKFNVSQIIILPASFLRQGAADKLIKYDLMAIEFGTYTFSESEAEGGPSSGLQDGGEYWAIWDHKDDCTWEIGVEVGG